MATRVLRPPLQEPFRVLRFSPDGRYILAQDSSGIDVLTRQPLALAFRIEAPADALPVQFTPDSRSLVFGTPGLRVEQWDVESRQVTATEVTVENGCAQSLLSPDGRTLACLTYSPDRLNWSLMLVDVGSGDTIAEKKSFPNLEQWNSFESIILALSFQGFRVSMGYSTDGRFFLAHSPTGENFAYDLASRQPIPVKGVLSDLVATTFAFIGPDRIVGMAGDQGAKSAIAKFPSGEIVQKVQFGNATPSAATDGKYFIVRPTAVGAVGAFDVGAGRLVRGSKSSAFDVCDGVFLNQRPDGSIALYGASGNDPTAAITLPKSLLGTVRTVGVSGDLNRLAIAVGDHCSIWNLQTGNIVVNLRGFRGADFEPPDVLFAEFPKSGDVPPSIAKIDMGARSMGVEVDLGHGLPDQWGRYLLAWRPITGKGSVEGNAVSMESDPDNGDAAGLFWAGIFGSLVSWRQNWQLDVSDARTGAVLWSRKFPKLAPDTSSDPRAETISLIWRGNEPGAQEDADLDPQSRSRFAGTRAEDQFIEFLDIATGKTTASLRVDTHNRTFRILAANLGGDAAVLGDNLNRLLIYSVSNGARKAILFGHLRAISPDGNILCYENSVGREILYDLRSDSPIGEDDLPERVSFARFGGDSRSFLVMTADQVAYLLRVPSGATLSLPAAH